MGEHGRARPGADILMGWFSDMRNSLSVILCDEANRMPKSMGVLVPGRSGSLIWRHCHSSIQDRAGNPDGPGQRFDIAVESEDGPLIRLLRSDLRD